MPPADGEICRTHSVNFLKVDQAVNGGPVDRRGAPLGAFFEIASERFHADTDSFELVAFEAGATTDVTGDYDRKRLTFARMDMPGPIELFSFDLGTGEATPSGRTATLGPMTWTASGATYVFGNDGPGFGELGRSADRCQTANFNAHQTIRPADLIASTPAIDGVPIDAPFVPDPFGAIFRNWFHGVVVTHHCLE